MEPTFPMAPKRWWMPMARHGVSKDFSGELGSPVGYADIGITDLMPAAGLCRVVAPQG